MNNLVVIQIINHKANLSLFEQISLKQCVKVLGHYPIRIALPKDCDPKEYIAICPKAEITFVNPKWLSSRRSYNKFRLWPFLYRKNLKYKYTLFYELDSFVFRDQLSYWCNKGYDLIGAPWFERFERSNPQSNFIYGANGGLTLRNTRKLFIALSVNYLFRRNYYNFKLLHEDQYLFKYITPYFPLFKVAPSLESLQFAFEVHPERCFKLNNNNLPFGVHAWHKYNLDFWRPFIEKEGYNI